ncbi:sugar ABC transporter substrate-binding protein [Ideonella alba]|uniref:Sugar ABC transporter substrate-binding protein n=1 Tax=Ideonella alba TaxID=2824118 RepID=A0A941BFX5_9BURK|nr:sugar ABC transporter substrate-binding protein [Ideonella alba]MBQ0929883.1 sugar ABC transporter substrate-binding protein [Ideonella alba]
MSLRRRHLLLAAVPLAGCSRPGAGELRFWAMGREGEVVAELLQDFRAEHPGIRLRIEQLPWSAAHEKLLTAFAGDATPDLAQLGNTWLPEFAALGALEPLAPWLAQAPEIDPADHFEGIWRTNLIDGTLVGLPWYVDTRLLFYRRDLLAQAGFDHPPADWAEWQRMLRAIRRRVGPANYAVLLPLNEYDPIVALGLQQDEPLLRDNATRGHFRSPGFRRAWDYFLSLYREQLAPPASNQEIANVWNEFGRGYFSFYISGPWQIGEFRRRLPPALQASWATAPLPGPEGTRGPGASIAGGASLAMFRRSTHKPEAFAVMRYLARPEVQQRFHAMTGNLPPRRSAWTGGTLASDEPTQAFRTQLEHVRPVPQVPEWERIATELKLVLEQVVRGTMAPETALAVLDGRTDRLLEKRRWMLARHGGAA